MNITIEAPAGPRTGVVPFEGIADEAALIKSLILTLAVEKRAGADDVTLTVDCSKIDANRLVVFAKMFGQMQTDVVAMAEFLADSYKGAPSSTDSLAEASRAEQLLDALERHIAQGKAPIHGYKAAANLIGWNATICLPVGQICSRLDLAALNAGLPLLALNWIRKPDGEINRRAFPPHWAVFSQQSIEEMVSHKWAPEHFELLRSHLQALPNKVGAFKLWAIHEADPHAGFPEMQQGKVLRHQMS